MLLEDLASDENKTSEELVCFFKGEGNNNKPWHLGRKLNRYYHMLPQSARPQLFLTECQAFIVLSYLQYLKGTSTPTKESQKNHKTAGYNICINLSFNFFPEQCL